MKKSTWGRREHGVRSFLSGLPITVSFIPSCLMPGNFEGGNRFSLWGAGEPCYVPEGEDVVLNGEKRIPDGFKGGRNDDRCCFVTSSLAGRDGCATLPPTFLIFWKETRTWR